MSILMALVNSRSPKRKKTEPEPQPSWVCPQCPPGFVFEFKSNNPAILDALVQGHNEAFHGQAR